ncbi:mesothelin-like protein [Hemiscyllium ocellatum]|uniref:mesothelin-like protein n=1 Tax=Hemiscyllium ocellatum TaxID=170820 RepID=UPI00296694F5|nr:mesothelin-like protein [Hemiscyllium ocellatum]XP_060696325.1 mesothelin-like protein [Hemiscyllium ocellatum]
MLPNLTISLKTMLMKIAFGFFVVISSTHQTFTEKVHDGSLNKQLEKCPPMLVKGRVQRATGCDLVFITPDRTDHFLLPSTYTVASLDACLNNSVLAANLTELGNLAFNTDQLFVIKRKLGEIYPRGLPQEEIKKLGIILTVYTIDDISQWNITDPDVLAEAVQNTGSAAMTIALRSHYLKGLGVLDATALYVIGGPMLCTASEEKLETISRTELRKVKPLDISACSQAKKGIMFGIAKHAFQHHTANRQTYYNSIKPYLDGATAADLRILAISRINMDYETFERLNPAEVEKLSAQRLRGLLGRNLNYLKENESQEIVRRWVDSHTAAEVMSLGIGLRKGESSAELGTFPFQDLLIPDYALNNLASVKNNNLLSSTYIAVLGIILQYV